MSQKPRLPTLSSPVGDVVSSYKPNEENGTIPGTVTSQKAETSKKIVPNVVTEPHT